MMFSIIMRSDHSVMNPN